MEKIGTSLGYILFLRQQFCLIKKLVTAMEFVGCNGAKKNRREDHCRSSIASEKDQVPFTYSPYMLTVY